MSTFQKVIFEATVRAAPSPNSISLDPFSKASRDSPNRTEKTWLHLGSRRVFSFFSINLSKCDVFWMLSKQIRIMYRVWRSKLNICSVHCYAYAKSGGEVRGCRHWDILPDWKNISRWICWHFFSCWQGLVAMPSTTFVNTWDIDETQTIPQSFLMSARVQTDIWSEDLQRNSYASAH